MHDQLFIWTIHVEPDTNSACAASQVHEAGLEKTTNMYLHKTA